MYSVIIAGGGGTRLWPLSTSSRPKPLIEIYPGKNLLNLTADRLLKVSKQNKIYLVITNQIKQCILDSLPPTFPVENIILEPESKNTAPCIALAAHQLSLLDPNATMGIFPSDHLFLNEDHFTQCIKQADQLAQKFDQLVVLGIKPDKPSSEYGHIVLGPPLEIEKDVHLVPAFHGEQFVEKPSLQTAGDLIQRQNVLWNCGIYIGKVKTFIKLYKEHLPEVINQIEKHFSDNNLLSDIYNKFPNISIDHAITQKLKSFIALSTQLNRIDIGNFISMGNLWPKDASGNAIHGHVISMDSHNNIVYSHEKLIAILGVSDLVIIDTREALLVTTQSELNKIKGLTTLVQKQQEP